MPTPSRPRLAILLLVTAMLACNAPGTAPTLSVNDQAATAIAMTLQNQVKNGGDVPVTATSSVTPTFTAAVTLTSPVTATITPTYSTPMLTVLQQTNCREGPGQDYQILFTYMPQKKLEIVGRYEPTNFWLVKTFDLKTSVTGTCWLWGEYVELSGSYWVVPTLTPPPTATMAPPLAPANVQWHFDCSGGNVTFTVNWEDRSTNETGYRIFRDGNQVVELPANSTSYNIVFPMDTGESTAFYVQVFSPSGTANSSVMNLTC